VSCHAFASRSITPQPVVTHTLVVSLPVANSCSCILTGGMGPTAYQVKLDHSPIVAESLTRFCFESTCLTVHYPSPGTASPIGGITTSSKLLLLATNARYGTNCIPSESRLQSHCSLIFCCGCLLLVIHYPHLAAIPHRWHHYKLSTAGLSYLF